MLRARYSGILLHPTSLPGVYGSGDFGVNAHYFIDWLAASGQSLWQFLPLGGIGAGNSPYMSPSAFAGNELLIDLAALAEAGWLSEAERAPDPGFEEARVDYPRVKDFRFSRLRRAARRFFAAAPGQARARFLAFCATAAGWLDDYALFMALDDRYGDRGVLWQDWPAPLAQRKPEALRKAAGELVEECDFWKFCQWCFQEQWTALKKYAHSRGVRMVGDIPIFVSPHSADVWAHQALFDLERNGHPRVIAGVPPDYFSATGQRWGNPLYRWPAHEADGFRWWIARLQRALDLCDIVRIDHFRGFESYWEIPASEATAIKGRWQPGPGRALFDAFHARSEAANPDSPGRAPGAFFIAEDLGVITPPVQALRKATGFPGMRILQFAFDGLADNLYLPHNIEADSVVYTGTHDNDTSVGWWRSLAEHEKDYVRRYLRVDGEAIHWDLIRAASACVADFAVVPMQDVLGLGTEARMNRPGLAEGSWEWRFAWRQVVPVHAERLAELTRLYRRWPEPVPSMNRS